MFFLFVVVTFFSSMLKEPYATILRAPSADVCEAKAAEQRAIAEKDPEVKGYSFTCVAVPSKT
jgi:hypothetical protein